MTGRIRPISLPNQKIFAAIFVMLLATAIYAQDEQAPVEKKIYTRNVDHSLPASPGNMVWAVCTTDYHKWPKRQQVAVSRTGLVVVMSWTSLTEATMVPLRIDPWEVRRTFGIIHRQSRNRNPTSPLHKDEPVLISCSMVYARPHLFGGTIYVREQGAKPNKEFIDEIDRLLNFSTLVLAMPSDPGKGPKEVADIVTNDIQFLEHFFSTMHINDGLTPLKRGGSQ